MYNINIKWKYRQNFGQLLISLGLGAIIQAPAAIFTHRYTFQQQIPAEDFGILVLLGMTSCLILGFSIASLAETWSKEHEITFSDTLAATLIFLIIFNLAFLGIYPTIQELDFVDVQFKQFSPEVAFFTEYLLGISSVLIFLWLYNWLRDYLATL